MLSGTRRAPDARGRRSADHASGAACRRDDASAPNVDVVTRIVGARRFPIVHGGEGVHPFDERLIELERRPARPRRRSTSFTRTTSGPGRASSGTELGGRRIARRTRRARQSVGRAELTSSACSTGVLSRPASVRFASHETAAQLWELPLPHSGAARDHDVADPATSDRPGCAHAPQRT